MKRTEADIRTLNPARVARIRELRDTLGHAWPAQWLRERGQFEAAQLWESYQ